MPRGEARSERERAVQEIVNKCGPSPCRISEAARMGWDAAIDAAAKAAKEESARLKAESDRYLGKYGTELAGGADALKCFAETIKLTLKGDRNAEQSGT